MLSQSLLQLRAVTLHPAPDGCVVDVETTLLEQFLNIAQRQRIAKIPPDRTKDDAGFGLPPFEDRGSDYFAILSRHQPATLKVATHPVISGGPGRDRTDDLFHAISQSGMEPERFLVVEFSPAVAHG
jgi:hypothetical protein